VQRTSLSNLSGCIHELVIGAVDRAGNSAQGTGEFNVKIQTIAPSTLSWLAVSIAVVLVTEVVVGPLYVLKRNR
jgi:hypothetical protein